MHSKTDLAARQASRIAAVCARERHRLGLRQDELALIAGVSTRVVHQIEAGKPTSRLDSLVPVLDALGLELRIESAHGQPSEGEER